MAITIDHAEAGRRMKQAIDWANDRERPVPAQWVEITNVVGAGTSKTYTAGLCTSLLAKATDSQVDPLAIKPERERPRSFSLRPLVEKVVVPASRGGPHPPFHLGVRKSQPANNQPYFRYSHLDDVERTNDPLTLAYLRKCLHDLDAGDETDALGGLAAFIRVRTEVERNYLLRVMTDLPTNEDIQALLNALETFLQEGSSDDRPLRVQAVVGGLVRATGIDVSAQGITDPSRHAPGDVHVPDARTPRMVAEVKGRAVAFGEFLAFLDDVNEYGAPAAWMVVLSKDHHPLDRTAVLNAARFRGLLVTVIEDLVELVAAMLGHPSVEVTSLNDAAAAIAQQLRDINAAGETLDHWAALFD